MISPSDVVAIIPARGGSKGIPRKNLQHVGGVPLIERCVRTALLAELVGSVWVSTDDMDIGSVAESAGARVLMRPAELSGDDASSESALLHAVETLHLRHRVLVFMQCTSPFTLPTDVDNCVKFVDVDGISYDCCFTCTTSPHRVWAHDFRGNYFPIDHEPTHRVPRQRAVCTRYYENGAVYAMRMDGFLKHRNRTFGRSTMMAMPENRSLEIDTPHDLLIARAICNLGQVA